MNINAQDMIWSLEPLFHGDHENLKNYCLGQSLKFWTAKMDAVSEADWDRFEASEQLFDECARILEEEESTHE